MMAKTSIAKDEITMETAVAKQSEDKKKSQPVTEDLAETPSSLEPELGSSAGMPLFLQRSQTGMLRQIQRKADGDGTCADCEKKEKEIQRKGEGSVDSVPEGFEAAMQRSGAGNPLDEGTRLFMESRFSQDFSDVRVHTDAAAAEAAKAVHAQAFTTKREIYFGSGQYQPSTQVGDKLLAHELTHTVQQGNGANAPQSANGISQPGEPQEQEADQIASSVMSRLKEGTQQMSVHVPTVATRSTPSLERQIWRHTDAGVSDAGVSGDTRQYKGETLNSDPAYTYDLLKRMIIQSGDVVTRAFVNDFELDTVIPKRPRAGLSDDPEFLRDASISSTLNEQYEKLRKEQDEFIANFEKQARDTAKATLEESQKHVLAEAVRYGVGDFRLEFSFWLGLPEIKGEVADNASTRGIAIAAEGLLARKKKADQAKANYNEFTHGVPAFAELASQRFHSQESEFAEKRGEITRTQRELDVYRVQVQMKFPLLAALGSDEDFKEDELENLSKGSKGKNADATAVIVDQIVEKLSNISKVKEELKPGGDVNIWLVPKIRESTKLELGVLPDTLFGRIIDDKVKDEQPSALTGILVGLLQLGLVLLAPATGGLTLIPAAAISVGTAYQHFKEYETQKALHGTDFGAAALSAEDPSLFWLAVDIVGAGFDVVAAGGPALRLFRELAPAARAVRSAQVGEDAVRTLERNAGELGGEALARRVGEDARALQRGTTKEIGITAEESRKFEQAAADIAEKELREGAQTAETLAGGKVTVSRSGGVFSCSSPCTMMRERFKDLLAREPKYSQRLNELEGRARSLPTGAEGDIARKQIANEAAALEREMRTTALPGDWTSPLKDSLKDSSEFDALVKRRGSVAAELDHHPPGWTGKDEAKFRYGREIEPEPRYRWTMEENGNLRYDRLDAALPPRRYNAATGVFEEAAEEGLIPAVKGAEETRELAKLPQKEREAMEAAFKKRGDFITERDRIEELRKLGPIRKEDADKLQKLSAQINEQSRQLGEQAAEAIMSGKGGKKIYPLGKTFSTSGDFDQVWKIGDEFHIVEAKGGSSGLGSRAIPGGLRAEQGTIPYAQSIAENMARNGATKEIRQLGRELQTAIRDGKVKYILVRAPIGTESGAAVLRDIKVSEFAIKK
jgi:Domain of unknown function (DUF4157)